MSNITRIYLTCGGDRLIFRNHLDMVDSYDNDTYEISPSRIFGYDLDGEDEYLDNLSYICTAAELIEALKEIRDKRKGDGN